jgi:hypothetical protein
VTRHLQPQSRGVKLRVNVSGRLYPFYSLTVPPTVARLVPEGTHFHCELVPEGILFRPRESTPEAELPDWVKAPSTEET